MNIRPYVRKAQYYETDQMGIIHHANYIHWMEEARVDFMEQVGFGYDRAVKEGIDFALLGLSCEYKSMVSFGDTVNIEVSISALTVTKMTVHYQITDAVTGKLRTTGESIHCYFDSNRKRPVSLKKVLPELYDLFASYVA
ncbi:acyl-CoA thioester hydrolase [Anaerocolumna jejuensis DSM 15929]|uniref:Acyl-CoA thioester hydrolase n=1 Tax=Anaerocolumna jejuensis DSM 15929 TaxID=1121322 RepID=A0A1M6PRG2_9FIRM|nr:thioesterase family protein [Anaerocolumna jejuensis]SHK10527.1 acyl-CoA thioester hydrolase [Anaerocolumna jejuensis DSM 15929]